MRYQSPTAPLEGPYKALFFRVSERCRHRDKNTLNSTIIPGQISPSSIPIHTQKSEKTTGSNYIFQALNS